MDRLTLKKLYNTSFPKLYKKLQKNENLSKKDLEKVLSIAIFLIGLDNKNLQGLGYRLFLLYSKFTHDYKPLYEVSLNKGLIPISQFIEHNLRYKDKFGNLYTYINRIECNKFKWNDSYQTIGQFELFQRAKQLISKSQIIVAPTSYGKTELILSFIEHNEFKKICIISPTKSLLAQTKKRIINRLGNRKIITYPEMYKSKDDEILAVLTQERLLRLLQSNPDLQFDLLIVDEAHNLLDKFDKENFRSIILASVIIICNKRNPSIVCKYLTPFLNEASSLSIKYLNDENAWYSVTENVKSELIYFYDLSSNRKMLLDQYSPLSDKFIDVSFTEIGEDADIVINNSDRKNIVYLNSPKDLELFASELSYKLDSKQIDKLEKAASDIREYVHDEYKLADYVEKGIIYHHGAILEPIRYFIENLYADIPEVNILIANSTLLEGVNIPATKMFILNPYRGNAYLSASSFKNLIGRVCRFSEIFDKNTGNLDYLLPEIHIVKGKYCNNNFNPERFIKNRNILIEESEPSNDEINNPLLKGYNAYDGDLSQKAEEILENISSSDLITDGYTNKPNTEVGKLCFENNVNLFNILDVEVQISREIDNFDTTDSLDMVFSMMNDLFFSKIDENDRINNNLKRLREIEAQRFYKMLINWRILGFNMRKMIDEVLNYWYSLSGSAAIVYVGKWGDTIRNGYKQLWTDISQKNRHEMINLAIVRIKEEFDFIDNEIIKYIEILYSLKLIEESLYLKIKYGTDNKDKIALLNCGISNILSKLLEEKYQRMYEVDVDNSIVNFSDDIVYEMERNCENGILISEVKMNLKE